MLTSRPQIEAEVLGGDDEERGAGNSGRDQRELQQMIDQSRRSPRGDHVKKQSPDGADEVDRPYGTESEVP